jgi:kojibiose phosphorylase
MMRNVLADEAWLIRESGRDAERANYYETIFTVGNGRLGTRGSLEEGHHGELSGTYLSGVYDSHDAPVIDLVNAPDWLWFEVDVDGIRLDVHSCAVVEHERALDIAHGLLWRTTTFEDMQGRRTRVETLRFISMARRSLCGLRVEITPQNHDSPIRVISGISGDRRNLERLPAYPHDHTFEPETRWEKWAHTNHLAESGRSYDGDAVYLEMRTAASGITIGYAASTWPWVRPFQRRVLHRHKKIADELDFSVAAGKSIRLDKFVAIATSRDYGAATDDGSPHDRALATLERAVADGFDTCLSESAAVWDDKWSHCDCEIVGDPDAAIAVRFSIYHLLIAANEQDPTVNIGAKSLSGEGYRGHVFWDTEVLMLPFYIYTQPRTAQALLRYRYHTLPGARDNARAEGRDGARYAWESADTGHEECPQWTTDGTDRLWMRDEEIHVGADVAYGVMSYVAATADDTFLTRYGAEILFETCRFWVDRMEYDPTTNRYCLNTVMGPDEFHIHVDNNAYTNGLVRWQLDQASAVYEWLRDEHPEALAGIADRIGLRSTEVEQWRLRAEGLVEPAGNDTGVIEQFRGYFGLDDVPVCHWDDNNMPQYPDGYNHFNCDTTTLLKQPDVVMLMYLLPDKFSADQKRANFDYYEARTLHKSSLSPSIHAIMGVEVGDYTRAEQYFTRSAFVDLADNQRNTQDGIHIASAGGTWQTVVCGFGGFRVRSGLMSFDPWLPPRWERLSFRLHWHGRVVAVTVTQHDVAFELDAPPDTVQEIIVEGEPVLLRSGEPVAIALTRRGDSETELAASGAAPQHP